MSKMLLGPLPVILVCLIFLDKLKHGVRVQFESLQVCGHNFSN